MQVKSLGYLVVQSPEPEKWTDYGENVVGMMTSTTMPSNGSVYLKMDHRPFRYQIVKGEFDGLLYAGWDLGSQADFDAGLAELTEKGVAFEKVEDGTNQYPRR